MGDNSSEYDPSSARSDVPILSRILPNGRSLVYLDNAATTQKPHQVIEAITAYYELHNSNVHRALHTLAHEATTAYEGVRDRLATWFGAVDRDHLIFTSGTTEALNLVARAWGMVNLSSSDVILLTEMEHHSSHVPWQMVAASTGSEIRHIPVDETGANLDLANLDELLDDVRVVGCVHTSNVLGTRNPVEEIIAAAKKRGAKVVIDAAQAAAHERIDASALGCDFLAASSHKMFGPTGVGCLVVSPGLFDEMQPFLGGGDMIKEVFLQHSSYAEKAHQYEAGTPKIAEVIGWGASVEWLRQFDFEAVHRHTLGLARRAANGLVERISNVRIFGDHSDDENAGIVSFLHPMIHANDLATLLDTYGVAVRSGHHCAQPLMRRLGVSATSRVSFALYNNHDDVDRFLDAMTDIDSRFSST